MRCILYKSDWRGLEPEAQEILLQNFFQWDREQGLGLTWPPSSFISPIGARGYLVSKQVFAAYEAICVRRPLPQAAGQPYRDYIAWLPQQDLADLVGIKM